MPTFDWTWEEVVLAADLTRQNGWKGLREPDPRLVELSRLLRGCKLHGPQAQDEEKFRSPGSIRAKSNNVATLRADYSGVATRGGQFDELVVRAFEADEGKMIATANLIRAALSRGETLIDDPLIEEEENAAHEGRLIPSMRMRRERDRKMRASKLAAVIAAGQPVACEVCGFDFHKRYGPRGEGYIEVHHIAPLHLTGPTVTKHADLVLLCANCHRMAHYGHLLTPSDLKALLE